MGVVAVAARRCSGCCPRRRWGYLIANVVEGVAHRVAPLSLPGFDFFVDGCFVGPSLVVFACLFWWGLLLVAFDCGCGRGLSWRVLCGV